MKELIKQAKQGDAEAQFLLGLTYYNGDVLERSPEKAFKWINAAAKGNYTDAFEYIKEICKAMRENTKDCRK